MLTAVEAHEIAKNSDKVKEYLEKICSSVKTMAKQGHYNAMIVVESEIEEAFIDELKELGYFVRPLSFKYCNYSVYKIYW